MSGWERGPSSGLDLGSQTNKKDFFSYGLKVTAMTCAWTITKASEVLTGAAIRLCSGGGQTQTEAIGHLL